MEDSQTHTHPLLLADKDMLTSLPPEIIHTIALSGYLGASDVRSLSLTCTQMAAILHHDPYARDLCTALSGLLPNLASHNWTPVRYAIIRRWYDPATLDLPMLWKKVVCLVTESHTSVLDTKDQIQSWEGAVLAALSLPCACGYRDRWKSRKGNVVLSLLHVGARFGTLRLVNWVLGKGAKVDVTNRVGETPLWVACQNGHLEVVKRLVENGADVGVKDVLSASTLWTSACNGHAHVVQYLLSLGCLSLEEENRYGMTPLGAAYKGEHLDVVRVLLEAGAEDVGEEEVQDAGDVVERASIWGMETREGMLFAACQEGNEGAVRALMETGGVDVNVIGDGGATPLYVACRAGHTEVVRVLVEGGADPGIANAHGVSPAKVARRHGHRSVLNLLSPPLM